TNTSDANTIAYAEVPAVLTEEGAAAFGTYPAGSDFDALSFTGALADCADNVAESDAAADNGAESVTAESNDLLWLWIVLGVVAVAAIAGTVVAARRKQSA